MKEMDVDARFTAPVVRGSVRLLSGMVLANRPWKLFPSFKGTLAAAFATGAYALVITTLWILADSVGWPRLLLLMVTAIVAMVAWIIVAHHLWERQEDCQKRKWVALYNGVTVLTISVAVLIAYAVLFALIFIAAWVFVPGTYFQTILKHPVGFSEYLTLSWMAASLATLAGALGSSLEDEDAVRGAAYGYRQRRRNQTEDSGDGQNPYEARS
jgi:glucose uptake protein GlcU